MLGYLTSPKHKESHGWVSLNDPLGARNPATTPDVSLLATIGENGQTNEIPRE